MLDKLMKFRNKIMSAPPPNRNVKIYHKRFDARDVPHFVIDMDLEMGKGENAGLAKYWSKIIKDNQKKANFQSKRKMEFEFLIAQQVYR